MGYHFHVDFVSRGKGQSLVAKGAYQARAQFREERTGEYKDYTHKPDRPVKSFIFVNKKHGAELQDIEGLLNAIDRAEGQANSQTGLNFTAALPKELSDEDHARMVRDFGREHFLRKGIPAIAHIHPPHEHAPAPGQAHDHDEHAAAAELDNGNPHVHMLAGTRILGPDGQFGEKHITWDSYREFLEHKRERWAELGARYLENAGFQIEAERWRYGHLTNPQQREKAVERGDHEWAEKKAQEPGKHRGPNADAIERKGIETDLGNASREIQQRNEDRAELRALKRGLVKLERQDAFDNLKHEMSEAEKVLDIDRMLAADLLKLGDSDPARFEKQWQTARNIPGVVAALESLKAEQQRQENENRQHELADLDKFLAAQLYEQQKKYPNHFRTHQQDHIPAPVVAEMEKLAAAEAEREYAQGDPAREQIAWEDAVAKSAIEKEKKEQRFLARGDRDGATRTAAPDKAALQQANIIRMYRGIGKNVSIEQQPEDALFFSTDPLRAAAFGKLHYVDITLAELAKFEQPHSKRIREAEPIAANDWKTGDPEIIARLKPLGERQFVEPAPGRTGREPEKHEPTRPRFGDVLITRAADAAMRDQRQQHGEPVNPAAFKDALEKNRLALACVTPDEAAKSRLENKFAKELGRYAPVYQAGEIVIVREPRPERNTGGRVHKLDQTKAEDYLRCLALDKSQLQGIEATKQALDERAQTRQRAIDAAKLRKARSRSRSPERGGLVAHQMWAVQRARDADQQRREPPRRPDDDYMQKQKRDSAEIDPERYRSDPDYRRHAQTTQAYKSPEEKKRDRENDVRAIMEQQDRGR